MSIPDLTFWVDYEKILFRMAVQPPAPISISQYYHKLLEVTTDPNHRAICERNMALLVLIKRGSKTVAVSLLQKALETAENPVLKLQVLLLLNLLGISDNRWESFYSQSYAIPSKDRVRAYVNSLVGEYRRLQGGLDADIDFIAFLAKPI